MKRNPPRFRGAAGKARLLNAIRSQKIVGEEDAIAKGLAKVAIPFVLEADEELMAEGEFEDDVYFILSGKVAIRIKRKQVNVRVPGDHVGEMALIDPLHPRSASVIATERTEVAKVTERDFTKLAEDHPILWRRLSVELGHRLRQRGELIPSPNPIPVIFIGSSSKQSHIVDALEAALKGPKLIVRKWTEGVFGLSSTTIESLEKTIGSADFAVILLSGDDPIKRGKVVEVPRDNCVFELGLGMGALGRERTFILKEDKAIHLPSDLQGVTYEKYDASPKVKLAKGISSAARKIKALIELHKSKQPPDRSSKS
jgi:predicted nucleotide-binding protein